MFAKRPVEGIWRLTAKDSGGANRDRTGDLLLAKQALSQLSYGPDPSRAREKRGPSLFLLFSGKSQLVGLGGLEPPTPRLSSVCSNQLSYRPCLFRCCGRQTCTADRCGRERLKRVL